MASKHVVAAERSLMTELEAVVADALVGTGIDPARALALAAGRAEPETRAEQLAAAPLREGYSAPDGASRSLIELAEVSEGRAA